MKCDYQIEDILQQTDESLVYSASGKHDGAAYTLTLLKYPDEVLENLRDGRFERALQELKKMEHSCLRPVVDGGIDPVDFQPWIATRAWAGVTVAEAELSAADFQRIEIQGKALIASFVERAGALDFRPEQVVLSTAVDGQPITTFCIDYLVWFRDLAMGYEPGFKRDAKTYFSEFLGALSPSGHSATLRKSPAVSPPVTVPLATSPTADTSPSQPVVLASAQGGGGAKPWIFIGLLSALLAGGVWWATQDSEGPVTESPEIMEETPEPSPEQKMSIVEASSSEEKTLESTVAAPSAEPNALPEEPVSTSPLPDRPSPGEMRAVAAVNKSQLDTSSGSWVTVSGKVESIAGSTFTFVDSGLVAKLDERAVTSWANRTVEVIGYLRDSSELVVEGAEDVLLLPEVVPEKEVYTIEDKDQLLQMSGKNLVISGKVREAKASGSGKTLYLVLNEGKPEIAAAVYPRTAEASLTLEFLSGLVGKQIRVSGRVRLENSFGRVNRLLVIFTRQTEIAISE